MEKLSKNKIEILNLYIENVFLTKTIREISKILKKSYPKVYEAIKELEKQNILKITRVGKSSLCTFVFSKEAISLISFLETQNAISKNIPEIDKILNFKEFLDDIVIVTGSYAKNKPPKNSDIDLVIITKKDAFSKQRLLENMTLTFLPIIHVMAFTYKDFIEMLLSKESNFGKEVFKNRILFRNIERYYHLINEAIENGFKS